MKSKRLIILASASPRRRQLLRPFYKLKIWPADCDESQHKNEKPRTYVRRVAHEKWSIVAKQVNARLTNKKKLPQVIISADTTVVLNSKILGKPRNQADAKKMILKLSGKTHKVMTAVSVGWSSDVRPRSNCVVSTSIRFKKISSDELSRFLRTKEWRGKAGAYGIQGAASKFVMKRRGSFTNVVGLPVDETISLIAHTFSHPLPKSRATGIS
jgi:septum formation protein